MNTKLSLATLIAAVTLAGAAVAQTAPVTSTPGAGCTATANAMRGGNLGGTATNKECTSAGAKTATTTTAAPMVQAAPMNTTTTAPSTSGSTAMAAPAEPAARPAPMRVARADRN